MTCAADAAAYFKASVLYGLFENIDTQAGDAAIDALASYICECLGGEFMLTRCPLLFKCYVVHLIAYLLVTWGFQFTEATDPGEEPDGSGYVVPPVSAELERFVKRDMVGRVTREYDWPPDRSKTCKSCDDEVLNQWKLIFKDAYDKCQNATNGYFMGGGSNFPDCDIQPCCGQDRKKI